MINNSHNMTIVSLFFDEQDFNLIINDDHV